MITTRANPIRHRYSCLALATVIIALSGCEQPQSPAAPPLSEEPPAPGSGRLSIVLPPSTAAWIESGGAASKALAKPLSSSSRAFAFPDRVVLDIRSGMDWSLSETYTIEPLSSGTVIDPISIPVGTDSTATVDVIVNIYNEAVSHIDPVVHGHVAGIFIREGEESSATVTCTPWKPQELEVIDYRIGTDQPEEAVTHELAYRGEKWYSVEVAEGLSYFVAQRNRDFRIGLFDKSGLYVDSSEGAPANYSASIYFKYTASYTGKLYLAIVNPKEGASENGELFVTADPENVKTKELVSFTVPGDKAAAAISADEEGSKTIKRNLKFGHVENLAAFAPAFEATGARVEVDGVVQVSGETVQDFSDGKTVVYRVIPYDGEGVDYQVTLVEDSPFTYTVTDEKVAITGLTADWEAAPQAIRKNNLAIPATLAGYDVARIDPNAFEGKESLKSVALPDSLASIGEAAFAGCAGLESIALPASLRRIDQSAFKGCSSLASVSLNEGLAIIGNYAFQDCAALAGIAIPKTVESIGNLAFNGCGKLASLELPEGLKAVFGNSVFRNCTGLKSVAIPGTMTSVGTFAFSGCTSLASVTMADGVKSIGNSAFENCTSLTSISIPWGVTSMGISAFSGCTVLKSVTLPDSLVLIGAYAFQNCTGLAGISIPGTVKSVGTYAFSGCAKLASVAISEGVTSIGAYAFSGCSGSVSGITIPASLASIGDNAFRDFSGLKSVTISSGITSIGEYAFRGCKGLTKAILPDGLTSIGYAAFYECWAVDLTIPATVTTIGSYAFYDCGKLVSAAIPAGLTVLGTHAFAGCASLPSITIPPKITAIPNFCFSGCKKLTNVVVPSTVKGIGYGAFGSCDGLTSITLNVGLTSIGGDAFRGCIRLKGIAIPEGVTKIESNTFWNCYALASVSFPSTLTWINEAAFYAAGELTRIEIPANVVLIGNMAFSFCTKLESLKFLSSIPFDPLHDLPRAPIIFYVPQASLEAYKTKWTENVSQLVGY